MIYPTAQHIECKTVYKLFRQMKDGCLAPLYINKRLRLDLDTWYPAEHHPTNGYADRPGWHCAESPNAPHLKEEGRIWVRCSIPNTTIDPSYESVLTHRGFYRFPRPACQGGEWLIASHIKLIEVISQ